MKSPELAANHVEWTQAAVIFILRIYPIREDYVFAVQDSCQCGPDFIDVTSQALDTSLPSNTWVSLVNRARDRIAFEEQDTFVCSCGRQLQQLAFKRVSYHETHYTRLLLSKLDKRVFNGDKMPKVIRANYDAVRLRRFRTRQVRDPVGSPGQAVVELNPMFNNLPALQGLPFSSWVRSTPDVVGNRGCSSYTQYIHRIHNLAVAGRTVRDPQLVEKHTSPSALVLHTSVTSRFTLVLTW
jgi:hypothetical protein